MIITGYAKQKREDKESKILFNKSDDMKSYLHQFYLKIPLFIVFFVLQMTKRLFKVPKILRYR